MEVDQSRVLNIIVLYEFIFVDNEKEGESKQIRSSTRDSYSDDNAKINLYGPPQSVIMTVMWNGNRCDSINPRIREQNTPTSRFIVDSSRRCEYLGQVQGAGAGARSRYLAKLR